MAYNFRLRNNLGQFIALEDFDTDSSTSINSSISNSSVEDQDNERDPINDFENLNLHAVPLNFPLPVIMAFNLNPYNGDINPSTSEGLKLFLKATEEKKEEQKLKISQTNVKNIMSAFESDARKYGWSSLVHIVPINDAAETKSIIKDCTSVTLSQVKKQARATWGDRTAAFNDEVPDNLVITEIDPAGEPTDRVHFYRRTRATMIAKRVEGLFDEASMKTLFNKKREFTWTDPATGIEELDGPTMLQIIIQGINPTTRVGVSDYKMEIQNATLPKHNNNVQDMLDYMEMNYEHILRHNFTHPDYVMHLFNALLTSKNDIFRSMIQREKDKWELGEDVLPDSLVDKATTKYNNMVLQKLWNQTDPKDAKILALTTKLELLASAFSTSTSAPEPKPLKQRNDNNWKPEPWQITNVGPKIDDPNKPGKTLWWCPHHKGRQNKWPGMYMNHEEKDHDKWQSNKTERYGDKKKKTTSANNPPTLTLSDKMKSAMATKMCLTPQALDEMMADPDLK